MHNDKASDFDKAINYNEEAIRLTQQLKYADAVNKFQEAAIAYPKLASRFLSNQGNVNLQEFNGNDHESNLQDRTRLADQQSKALKCYEKAIELDPKFGIAIYNRANLLRTMGLNTNAEVEYNHALNIAPQMVEARINLAELLITRLRLNDAIAQLEEARLHAEGSLGDKSSEISKALEIAKIWQARFKALTPPASNGQGPGSELKLCPQLSVRIARERDREKAIDGGNCPQIAPPPD